MAEYELWLTDDSGKRLELLQDVFYFQYTRTTRGLGSFSMGLSFLKFSKKYNPFFIPDWRVDVWRSPQRGVTPRREDMFLLRKPDVFTRQDGVQVIQFHGRNGMDLLHRRAVIQRGGTSQAQKTDKLDDLMKAIVREQMLYGSTVDENGTVSNTRAWPQNEFFVQANQGLGPTVTKSFADRNVLDVLNELKDSSLQMYRENAAQRKIYFEVFPRDITNLSTSTNAQVGWEFRTHVDLYGVDRTQNLQFSENNENIANPQYALNYLDEVTSVTVRGNGSGASQIVSSLDDPLRINSSRWNRSESVVTASSETTTAGLQNAARSELFTNRPKKEFTVTLLDRPSTPTMPQSLYGIDWSLGDLVKVNYAGQQFNLEIETIYVAVNDQGQENISGKGVNND